MSRDFRANFESQASFPNRAERFAALLQTAEEEDFRRKEKSRNGSSRFIHLWNGLSEQ
jgi:hypothetical protein